MVLRSFLGVSVDCENFVLHNVKLDTFMADNSCDTRLYGQINNSHHLVFVACATLSVQTCLIYIIMGSYNEPNY